MAKNWGKVPEMDFSDQSEANPFRIFKPTVLMGCYKKLPYKA